MLTELKSEVIKRHKNKVNAWNRLVSNPFTKANENQYYFSQSLFDNAVNDLVDSYLLAKRRGIYDKSRA